MRKPAIRFLSFTGLITSLAARIKAADLPGDDGTKVATTLRLSPPVRHYFELQAANLNVSAQDCMAMTLSAVMRASCEPQSEELDAMIDKVFGLFSAHGISMVDIPSMVPKHANFLASDMLSRVKILDKFTSPIIDEIAKLFYVNPTWVKSGALCAQPRLSSYHSRTHDSFMKLAAAKRDYHAVRLLLVTASPQNGNVLESLASTSTRPLEESPIDAHDLPYIVMVMEITKRIGAAEFVTYLPLEKMQWSSKVDRLDTKLIMMFCEKTSLTYHGCAVSPAEMQSIIDGDKLLVESLRNRVIWHPDTLLWTDERNPEIAELELVKASYKDGRFNELELAMRMPWDSSMLDPIKV